MGLWVLSSKRWAAPASAPVNLELVTTNPHTTRLEVVSELAGGPTKLGVGGGQRGLEDRVLDLLGQGATLTRDELRDSLGVKNERLSEALDSLERAGRLGRTPGGWQRLCRPLEEGRSRSP